MATGAQCLAVQFFDDKELLLVVDDANTRHHLVTADYSSSNGEVRSHVAIKPHFRYSSQCDAVDS